MSYFRRGLRGLGDSPPDIAAERLINSPGHSPDDPNCRWVGVPITEGLPGYQQVCPDAPGQTIPFLGPLFSDLATGLKNILSGAPATAGRALLTANAEIPKVGMSTTTKVAIAGGIGLAALLLLRSSKR